MASAPVLKVGPPCRVVVGPVRRWSSPLPLSPPRRDLDARHWIAWSEATCRALIPGTEGAFGGPRFTVRLSPGRYAFATLPMDHQPMSLLSRCRS